MVKKERYLIRQETRQYMIQIFNKISFFKYRTREIKATEISKLIILIEMAASQAYWFL